MNEGCRRPSALRELIARHGVTRPRVFGGAARGEDQEGSDLDLSIDPAPTTTRFTLAALQRSRSRIRTRGRDAGVCAGARANPGDLPRFARRQRRRSEVS